MTDYQGRLKLSSQRFQAYTEAVSNVVMCNVVVCNVVVCIVRQSEVSQSSPQWKKFFFLVGSF